MKYGYAVPILDFDQNFYLGIVLIPLFWALLYWIIGSYRGIYRKSRVREVGNTLVITFLGTIVLFFLLLLDDEVLTYDFYRYTFTSLFLIQFTLITVVRLILLTRLKRKLITRQIGFNTLLVGDNEKAVQLFQQLEAAKEAEGYKFVGFVTLEPKQETLLEEHLPKLGTVFEILELIKRYQVEEVIIAIESHEHEELKKVLAILEGERVIIKILPDMYDIIAGAVKMNHLFGTVLIEIQPEIMPQWQKHLKRLFDVALSALVLVLGLPLFLAIALAVRLGSKGPIFYSQERIGQYGRPFHIHKFRTMFTDAEKQGPQLSSDYDPRITPTGRLLRKYRLDELPQFWNVVKGDMSLVGPRPERQFFIDQIVAVAPHYRHLLRVRPGITSWGQIKFGYASTVQEMVDRMKFDILYVENMSLSMDLKILFYTVAIIFQGKGK